MRVYIYIYIIRMVIRVYLSTCVCIYIYIYIHINFINMYICYTVHIKCSQFHDVLSRPSRGKTTSVSESNNGYQQVVPAASLCVLLFLRIGAVQNLLLNELKPFLIGSLRHSRVTSVQCHHDLWSWQASSMKQGVHCY